MTTDERTVPCPACGGDATLVPAHPGTRTELTLHLHEDCGYQATATYHAPPPMPLLGPLRPTEEVTPAHQSLIVWRPPHRRREYLKGDPTTPGPHTVDAALWFSPDLWHTLTRGLTEWGEMPHAVLGHTLYTRSAAGLPGYRLFGLAPTSCFQGTELYWHGYGHCEWLFFTVLPGQFRTEEGVRVHLSFSS